MVDGAGQFTMNGVPPGAVTLTFTGEGVSASITLNNVNAGDEIRIEVRLDGNSARIESETRRQGDDDDANRDEANEVEGAVSALSGTCPGVAFTACVWKSKEHAQATAPSPRHGWNWTTDVMHARGDLG